MAKQVKDRAWLKQQLVTALHWDEDVTEGVLGLIVNASSPEEVQDITAAYMDNNPAAVCAISDFLAAKSGGKKQPQQQQQQQGRQPPRQQQQEQQQRSSAAAGSSYSTSVSAPIQLPASAKQAEAPQKQQDKWLHLGAQPAAAVEQAPAQAADAAPQVSSKQQAEATLSMFKRGGRLASKPAGGAGGGGGQVRRKGEQLDSITSKLQRKVANCLSCGRIFDCRNVTNDIIRFIDSGFKCTYCGAAVAMTQQQRIQQAQQQQQHEQEPGDSSNGSSAAQPNAAADAQAKAIAFKDRLVEYDRHAQKRTTVIDDQSDFFEIETNAWLTEEERAELRRRAQLEEEAAAARRNKVTVTLDLLGRKVVVADTPGGAAAGPGAAGSSFELGGGSATQQLLQQVQAVVAPWREGNGAGDGSSQEGGSEGPTAAGGSSASKAPAETLADALAAISNLRISAHPNLTATPVFVPKRKLQQQQQQQEQQQASSSKGSQQESHGQQPQRGKQQQKPKQGSKQQAPAGGKAIAAAGKGSTKQQQRQRLSAAASRAAAANSRVQDDSIFGDFEAELLCDELLQKQPAQAVPVARA